MQVYLNARTVTAESRSIVTSLPAINVAARESWEHDFMSGTTGVEIRYSYLACLPARLVHFANEQVLKKVMQF
jgi:hypothetical protein